MRPKDAITVALAAVAFSVALCPSGVDSAEPDSFVLRAGRILPVDPDLPEVIEDGILVVRQGRITAVGAWADVDIPPDLIVVDLPDATVAPGFVAATSGFGQQHHGDESVAAGYRAVDSFDRYANQARSLASGVTTVHVNSGTHRLLTGQGAVARLGGAPGDRVLLPQANLTINLGPVAHNPPAEVTYPFPASADVAIEPPRRQRPASRMGQLLALDEAIRDAMEPAADEPNEPYSLHGTALRRAWTDGLPLRIRADRAADLLAGIKFLKRHQRTGYLVGAAELEDAADAIRRAGVPVVYQPRDSFHDPGGNLGTSPTALDASIGDFTKLKGLTLALAPPAGKPVTTLRMVAVRAVGAGMDRRQALAAITRIPAEILGVGDRVGSLTPGKDADLLVMTGHPMSVSSHVQRVYIRGQTVFTPPAPEAGGSLVVRAGTIWIAPGAVIHDGQILIEDGKIVAVGTSVPHPPFARVIDAGPNGFVTPGFIDAHGHLGLDNDRTSLGNDLRLSRLVGVADVTDARVAAAGVTTVHLAPYAVSSLGGASAAVKTAGANRSSRVIRDPVAVVLDVRRTDPLAVAETLEKPLAAGKKYLDLWAKYDKELKEFLEKKEKSENEPQGDNAKKEEVEETKETTEPDALTGVWEATITGLPTPEPITMTVALRLSGSTVEGRITRTSFGVTATLIGTFDGKRLSAEITLDADVPGIQGPIALEADLTEEDRFQGTITVMGIAGKIEGRRTDKSPVELSVARTRRTRAKDGRPLPPKLDEALEPLKALLEKKIPAVVRVSTAAQIREVLALLVDKHELTVTLVGAEGAAVHAAALKEKHVVVIVPPAVIRQRNYRDYHQADDLTRRGVSIAFQSDAEDAARQLPSVALWAVQRGLDAESALGALTLDAAKALGIDDRVGSLEPGKDGDLVIFSGHPFQEAGRVLRVIVDGKEVRP